MPGDDLIEVCLKELRGADGSNILVRLTEDRAVVLLGAPGVSSGLIADA